MTPEERRVYWLKPVKKSEDTDSSFNVKMIGWVNKTFNGDSKETFSECHKKMLTQFDKTSSDVSLV
jgi:hypothetical protein